MDSEFFEKTEPTRLFFRLSLPAMISMAFGALYQIADGLFVGRFIGEDALAAINLIMPIIMMVFAVSNMIAAGSSARISILLGEKNREEASRVFSFSLKVIFFLSCVIGVFGLLFAEPFVRSLSPGATESAIGYGTVYVRMYALFSPFLLVFFATDNYLRTCGKERVSMWIGIGTQLLNILLDVILIAILGQGIWAAAFTSCIAMTIGSLISLFLFQKKKMDLYYTRENLSLTVFFRILSNGFSEFFNNISMSVMSIVYNLFLLKYGGTTAVAAFSVIMYVDSIVGMLIFGMCEAIQPAIGYLYGAGLSKKVSAMFRRLLLGAVVLSICSMLFMMFLGGFVAPVFVKPEDGELLKMSIVGMKLFSLSYLTGWVDMCFSSYFTALEKPGRSLAVSFFGTLVAPIVFLFLLAPILDLKGIWLSAFYSCTASAIVTLVLFFSMKKKEA